MCRGIFTVGVVVTNGTFSANDKLGDYSRINARSSGISIIARCLTGLGPSGNDNSVLGGLYFNGSKIPHRASCIGSSNNIISEPGTAAAGVFNIQQCRALTTAAEGVYTCTMMNSSMMNESIRFGVYFSLRSESADLYPVT